MMGFFLLICWSSALCFMSSGGHRLGEAGPVSVSREWESETEPERNSRPPAAALNHPLPVEHHAHQGERDQHSWVLTDIQFRPCYTCNLLCFRKMRTSVAECSSWSSPYSSVLSSCRKWSGGVNKASGEEARSWGRERTEWETYSWSWIESEARSPLLR